MTGFDFTTGAFAAMSWLPAAMFLAKASVLLVVAFALTLLMQRTSAVSRHLVWFVALLALLLMPVLAALSPWRLPVLPALSVLRPAPAQQVVLVGPPMESRPGETVTTTDANGAPLFVTTVPAVTPPNAMVREVRDASQALVQQEIVGASNDVLPAGTAPSRWPRIAIVLGVAWGSVTIALTLWLLVGTVLVRRIVRRAKPITDGDWQATLHEIADRMALDAAPRLVRSDAITMPFACGVREPTIVLPAASDSWSAERRAAVLLHELAHIKRYDIVAHTLSRLACVLYWFHPLVWTAARKMRAESERACDDLALLSGIRASDYAEHLLDIVTSVRHHRAPALALAMATRGEFEGRMLAILDPERRRRGPGRAQSTMLVAGGVLVAALLGVVTPASSRAADIGATSSSTQASSASTRSRARAAQVPAVLLSPSTTSRTTSAPMSADSNGVPSRGNTVNSGAFQALRRERPTEPARSTAPAGISTVTSEAVAAPLNASISVSIPSTAVSVSTPQTSQRAARLLPLVSPLSDLIFSGVAKGFATAQVELSKTLSTSAKGDTSARPALLAKLLRSEPTAELRRVAAWGLERFADTPVAIEALSNAVLQDSSSAVREMAAWALQGSDGSAKAISALANAARRDPAASVRYSAIWSLAHTANAKDKDALDALSAVAEARYANASDVREILAWAFGSMGPSSAPMSLTAMLADSAASVRITTAWALKTIGDPRTVSSLDAALRKEANHDAQFAMLRALASMGDAALPTISRLVDDTDPAIRALAIRSLAGAGLHDPWPQPRPRPRPRP